MLASGIMMQLDFLTIRYEELATQIRQSQPLEGKLIEQLDPPRFHLLERRGVALTRVSSERSLKSILRSSPLRAAQRMS